MTFPKNIQMYIYIHY